MFQGRVGGLGPFFSFHFFVGQVDTEESKNKYSSIAVKLFDCIVFFCLVSQKIYMYKLNMKFF